MDFAAPVPETLRSLFPADMTLADFIAIAWFLTCWMGFTLVQDHLLRGRVAVNQHLKVVRQHWMNRMLQRENRIQDGQLMGHTMNSCTFFASTNMLVLAALVGSFGAVGHAHELVNHLSFTTAVSRAFFEFKLLLIAVIFTFGFFKFTWSLRQYNYCCALIGAAPPPPIPDQLRWELARSMAEALTLALTAFNGGMRAYYFAMATLAWFISPWLFMLASLAVLVVLTRRQVYSATERVISRHTDMLEAVHQAEDSGKL